MFGLASDGSDSGWEEDTEEEATGISIAILYGAPLILIFDLDGGGGGGGGADRWQMACECAGAGYEFAP